MVGLLAGLMPVSQSEFALMVTPSQQLGVFNLALFAFSIKKIALL